MYRWMVSGDAEVCAVHSGKVDDIENKDDEVARADRGKMQ